MAKLEANPDEILEGIKVYHPEGGLVEIRIPKASRSGTIAGYFDDYELAAKEVAKKSKKTKVAGIYVTLNKINPGLLARYCNRLEYGANTTTSDKDVLSLQWLPIDIDAVRPAGISSSDEEHSRAIEKAKEIKAGLIFKGWPANAFILADSGNGGHLPARIELENTKENIELIKRCLEALDYLFSDKHCKVDCANFNPARIWKIPGTLVRKGENMPNRPHRLAKLLDRPEVMGTVSRELLEELAGQAPKTDIANQMRADQINTAKISMSTFDPKQYAELHGAKVTRIKDWTDPKSRKWKLAILAECPFNNNHNRGEVSIGVCEDGTRSFKCFHDDCKDKKWHELRDLWGPGRRETETQKGPTSNGLAKINKRIPDWIAEHHFKTVTDTERIYRYDHGVYLDDGETFLKTLIENEFSYATTNRLVQDIVGKVKRRTYADREAFNNKPMLNVKNGLLDLETLQLKPHTPDYLSTAQIDVTYDPKAKAPKIQKFLLEVAKLGDIALIEEIIGWLLWPDYNVHKAVMLLGPGRNGKGTLLRLITAFLGKKSISNVTLQDLTSDRFAKADLYGKLANIGGDLPSKDLSDTATFRNLTGGDDNRAQEKYKAAFNFRNKAKLLFSANVLPRSPDDTYAFYSRWILIEFLNIFDEQKGNVDPDLDAKLQTPEELSGLLNIALKGLKQLRENGWRFSYSKTVEDVEIMYKRNANPVLAFLMDECEEGGAMDYIEKTEFYNTFKYYTTLNGIRPLSMTKFGELLKDQTEIPVSSARPWKESGPRPMCWQGVKFKSPTSGAGKKKTKKQRKKSRNGEAQSIPSRVKPNPSNPVEKGQENNVIGKIGYKPTLDGVDCKVKNDNSRPGELSPISSDIKAQLQAGEQRKAEAEEHFHDVSAHFSRFTCISCGEPIGNGHSSYFGRYCSSCGPAFTMVSAAVKAHPESFTLSSLLEDLSIKRGSGSRLPKKEHLIAMIRDLGCTEICVEEIPISDTGEALLDQPTPDPYIYYTPPVEAVA